MLVLTEYIAKHELKPLRRYFDLKDVLTGATKVLNNLATEIRPPDKVRGFRFFKVRIGTRVKGRMIVFLVVANNKVVPLMVRLKKDKSRGMNMAINNPEVVQQLSQNLDHVLADIENGRYKEF